MGPCNGVSLPCMPTICLLVVQAVYTLGPLQIGVSTSNSSDLAFYNNGELIAGRTDKFCNTTGDGSLRYDHAVVVVGYQGSTRLTNGTEVGGSFIVKNSWDTAWGDAGGSPYPRPRITWQPLDDTIPA